MKSPKPKLQPLPIPKTPTHDNFRISERLKTNPDQSRRLNELTMENTRLKHEMEVLQFRLRQLETNDDMSKLRARLAEAEQESRIRQEQLMLEVSTLDKRLSKLNVMFQNLRSQNQRLENEAKAYQIIFEENNVRLERYALQVEDLSERMHRYKEIALMQREEYDSRLDHVKDSLKMAEKAREKLRKLQYKVDRILIEKSKEVEIWQNPEFDKDVQNVSSTVDTFSKDRSFFRQMLSQISEQVKMSRGSSLVIPNNSMDNYYQRADIPLEKLKLFYPTFLTFIEHQKKTLENELNGIAFKKTSVTFFATMRAILDAKWAEFLSTEQKENVTRFPEFAYGWLTTFVIDQITRKPRALTEQELSHVDDFIVKLVLDLSNPLTNKSWDCIMFKELIHDYSSQDELYFYLFCRNLLYRGPQMMHPNAPFEAIHYVPLPYAEFIVDHVLRTQESATIYQVKKCLRDKSQKKHKSLYIVDGAFVLRVLVEMYREERKNRYLVLKHNFQSNSVSASNNVSFKSFKRIVTMNFPYTTETQIATLFREAFAYGLYQRVGVTVDTFFSVCSDNGFFIKHLNLQPMIKHPQLANDSKLLYNPHNMEYIQFLKAMERFAPEKQNILILLESMGCEHYFKEFQWFYDRFIQNEFKEPLCIGHYKERNFTLVVQEFSNLLAKVRNVTSSYSYLQQGKEHNPKAMEFYALRNHDNEQQRNGAKKSSQAIIALDNFYNALQGYESQSAELEILQTIMRPLVDLPQLVHSHATEERKQVFCRVNGAKKLQKLVRVKLTKFYSFISSLLNAKVKSQIKR